MIAMADLPLLARDSVADKGLRFCLGAAVGVAVGWSFSLYGSHPATVGGFVALLGGFAVALGTIAVLGGNRVLEWLIRNVGS
jgi:hypothetical protein